jgi:hypothetical protein
MADIKRIDLGFSGGQVLPVRVPEQAYDELIGVLDGRDGWHTLEAEDAEIRLDLAQLVYVRSDTEEHRVGF